MKTTTTKKEVIGFDDARYNHVRTLETALFNTISELKNIAIEVLGKDYKLKDYASLLDDPFNYLVSEFWKINKKFYPEVMKPETAFLNISTYTKEQIESRKTNFWNKYNKLGKHKPTITKEGVVSTINKDDFNFYLAEDKREHYYSLKRFIEAFEDLRQYEGSGTMHLVKFARSLRLEGTGLKIYVYDFKDSLI